MKISHIQTVDKPSSIIVRNYDNERIVHFPLSYNFAWLLSVENEIGQWKIKYFNHVPKELNEVIVIVFEKL